MVARGLSAIWSALGSGVNNTLAALAVSGGSLYAGGQFTMAGCPVSWFIARYSSQAAPLQLTAAFSRKMHGALGPFDIALPLTGAPGVECRSSGGNHTVVFTFTNNVVSGSVGVTSGTGTVSGAPTFSGNTMTVNLSGVSDVQQIGITLSGITDVYSQVLPNTATSVAFLRGDVNADSAVNAGDAFVTRSRSGQDTNATNFCADVNADGFVNAGDALVVRAASGHSVP